MGPDPISADPVAALERLREGNRRFVSESGETLTGRLRPLKTAVEQRPFAVVLGCSDSRVPVEIVFDQGFGDLFVIRVAGNVAAASQVGSVEFAAEHFGTRLVVVLGHTGCGAVKATLDALLEPGPPNAGSIGSIVDCIRPAVRRLISAGSSRDRGGLVQEAVRANVRATTDQLRHGSAVLERLIQSDGLLVVGAEYSLESGVVEFFDGVPGAAPAAHEAPD